MEALAFGLGFVVSTIIFAAFLRWLIGPAPIHPPFSGPRYIFRLVKRDDRATYVRIMHRTLAVQMRDMSRAMRKVQITIGKALLPAIERTAAALREAFR